MGTDIDLTGYPLFAPPTDLAEKPRATWSPSDARRYFDWLMSVKDERAERIGRTLGLDPGGQAEDVLLAAGQRLAELLPGEGVSTNGQTVRTELRGHDVETDTGPLLTALGYALAADLGLLMARFLERACPDLEWAIVDRPKSDIDYRLPALQPFGPVHTDPIRISVNLALGVLGGQRPPSAWRDTYLLWREGCGAATR